MKLLSIIIPYYSAKKYTDELLAVLDKQMEEEVEVILVDDGSPEPFRNNFAWLKVIRIEHSGTSAARNVGLDSVEGEYVAFIDADDMVSKDYIQKIKDKIHKGKDYIELSWKSLTPQGMQYNCRVSSAQKLQNPSVCTRVFKRSFIGDHRFNESRDAGEDEQFTRLLDLSRGSRDFITSFVYFYRTDVEGSQVKRFKQGLTKTKRIVYNVPNATDPALVEEIKELDKEHEVFLFCEEHLPELERYCQVSRPYKTWAHQIKGEPCPLVEIISTGLKTQVVIYISGSPGHDGLSTFIYNFCCQLKDDYDITVLHDFLSYNVVRRLRPMVRVVCRNKKPITCDTLLMMRLGDTVPEEVKYGQMFQIVHCTKSPIRTLTREDCIFVSETSRDSFGEKGTVIYNIGNPTKPTNTLMLMSTSRIGASDKGDQDRRMVDFANRLNQEGIEFLWLYFSELTLKGAPSNMVRIDPVDDVRGYLEHADYLVHLSTNEAYCYSITEALQMGVPVITTDLPVLKELGFKDGKHGYIIKDDMSIIKKVPKFKGFDVVDEDTIIDKWKEVLGDTTPMHDYIPEEHIHVRCIAPYKDLQIGRMINVGEMLEVDKERAEHLRSLKLVEVM